MTSEKRHKSEPKLTDKRVQELYEQLIFSWREAFESLTPEERESVSNLDDFRAPCQLEVIALENRPLGVTQQLWFVSHFENEPDLTIIIHRPIDSVDAATKLPEIGKSSRFDRLLPEKTMFLGANTYRDLIEGHLLRLTESFRDAALGALWSGRTPTCGTSSKMMLSEEAFTWDFHGTLCSKAIDEIVERIVKHAKQQAKTKGQAKLTGEGPKRNEIGARGTYIFPHVWVGSRPSHSFEDDLNERMYARRKIRLGLGETVLFHKIGNLYSLATSEGFVGVTVEDSTLALRILNSFMALLTLRGIPALAARENELAELTIDPTTGEVYGSHMQVTLPRMSLADPSFVPARWQEERMSVLEVDLVKRVLKDLAGLLKDPVGLDLLEIFSEVYSHFQRGEYRQTILLAWTLVERWYVSVREAATRSGKLKSKRRPYRLVEQVLVSLEEEALIDSDWASNMHRLRQLRADVVHEFGHVSKDEAQIALNVVIALLQGSKM